MFISIEMRCSNTNIRPASAKHFLRHADVFTAVVHTGQYMCMEINNHVLNNFLPCIALSNPYYTHKLFDCTSHMG